MNLIDLSVIDEKYKDKCSLIKAGKCKNANLFIKQSMKEKMLQSTIQQILDVFHSYDSQLYTPKNVVADYMKDRILAIINETTYEIQQLEKDYENANKL